MGGRLRATIIQTGGRTDTVQYYSDWLLRRFEEGYVLVRNPRYPHLVTRYDLSPDKVDCVVFCSKDYRPILPRLHEVTDRFPACFFYTITAYGKDVEPGVPPIEAGMETLKALSAQVGRQRVAWCYDPVLLTKDYTIPRHLETFEAMARELAPFVDKCIFSFVEMYRKLAVNMPELRPVLPAQRQELAAGLGAIAARYGLPLQICGTDQDFSRFGIRPSGCMTLETLGKANGVVFKERAHRGMRPGCHCIEARDIGAYDSCPNGCRYCYANTDPRLAQKNYCLHDPASPFLLGGPEPGNEVHRADQRPFAITARLDDPVLPGF